LVTPALGASDARGTAVDTVVDFCSANTAERSGAKARRLFFESSSRFNFLLAHDLFRPAFARRSVQPNEDIVQWASRRRKTGTHPATSAGQAFSGSCAI
jgi:hypothetical protein